MADHNHNIGKTPTVLFFWETNRNCWVTDKIECRKVRTNIVDTFDRRDFLAIEKQTNKLSHVFLDETSQIYTSIYVVWAIFLQQ